MIAKLGQVMLYVNNQDEAVRFWTENAGFQVMADESNGEMRWIEIAPESGAGTTLVIHDRNTVARLSPGLDLGTPSLMFFTEKLDQFHQKLSENEVTVGDIVEMPEGRVFNFADYEANYFAVMEMRKA
ncbi:Glyoxalase-like domain protein [Planococcus massiliensis]|uniref:Glyoxalase-like domain protein n=1 Tax=Planococcus massiliensis TaxID=1499687 RepID=A0A098EN71_9BACL|nr:MULTISPECIES: VOC family protein [Planococcus]MCJ1910059.1 VOC family protein [Planococcus ruber]CEG23739.1 Glyoxalase-like domain protein [Planococcus massiliensis]